MSEKITNCYKAKDGKLFESEAEAKQYEAKLDFKEWYEEGYEEGSENFFSYVNVSGSYIYRNIDVLQDWLLKNKKEIINFILSYGEEKDV